MTEQPEVERVQLETAELAAETRQALADLLPGVVRDGTVDAQRLAEILGSPLVDGPERFGLSWAGKRDALATLRAPGRGALVPDFAESIDFDTARNVFIEGDNLEVLKLLQKSYNDQVQLMFIDPPYNTGNDFIYEDDFADTLRAYLEYSGQVDDDGNRRSSNAEVSGRKHSRWLSMMYPRLALARNLLAPSGALFVTIDENEVANLRLLLDEVFGPENFLAEIAWKHTQQNKNDEPYFSRQYNSILAYARSISSLPSLRQERRTENNRAYSNPDGDPRGAWRAGDVRSPSLRPTLRYAITTPSGREIAPPDFGWRWSRESVDEKIGTGEIVFSPDETRIVRKIYLEDQHGRVPENLWDSSDVGGSRDANAELKEYFGQALFDTPKPTQLVGRAIELLTKAGTSDVVVDFFAGSGTTGDSVMRANAADGGNRRFVLVQIPETTPTTSQAAAMGFRTISAIARQRLKLAAEAAKADRGLRCYCLSRSGATEWQEASGTELEQQLELAISSVRADVAGAALASEVFHKQGVRLDEPWHRIVEAGHSVIASGHVAVLLDTAWSDASLPALIPLDVTTVVVREDAFAGNDSAKANAHFQLRDTGKTLRTV